MGKWFGTDGIRGEANRPPVDGVTAFRVGEALSCLYRQEKERVRVAIGRDTRISGSMLECALAAGVAAGGRGQTPWRAFHTGCGLHDPGYGHGRGRGHLRISQRLRRQWDQDLQRGRIQAPG
ncbi:MAG: hypothetical protein U5R49_08435 [Deltaproteobacteria bacterium]|nr:hypothetical protein [Deltaproteobacteria bacterium]